MADHLHHPIEDLPAACPEDDRLENYLSALFELKYNISHIEKRYPFLGTELSAMCEDAISRLSPSAAQDLVPDELVLGHLPLQLADSAAEPPIADLPNAVFAGATLPPVLEPAQPEDRTASPVAYTLDAAGGILVSALDKMGDGIILAFEKLLWLGQRATGQPSAPRDH